ncbi:MAG: hypothetical protein VX871_00635 [Pseudomonadota bacterium]|nr:hypothetical protein [Pseudomonadota bacterium]
MVRLIGWLVIVAVIGIGAFALYDTIYGPPVVVLEYGKVTATSAHDVTKTAEARTRHVQRGELKYWEVELPDGSWHDCESDCSDAYRKQALDFWRARKEEDARR